MEVRLTGGYRPPVNPSISGRRARIYETLKGMEVPYG